MGRVSQFTRMERIRALINRRYEPEETRITAPFEFGGILRVGRKKGEFPDVWYITIPEVYVKRYRIRVDDEVLVHIGDLEPNTAIDELYHVSMNTGSCAIVLSKLKRKAGETENAPPEFRFTPGEFRTVRIEASPSKGRRWDLFYFYDRIRSISRKDPDRFELTSDTWDTVNNRPKETSSEDPETEPTTIFNDF